MGTSREIRRDNSRHVRLAQRAAELFGRNKDVTAVGQPAKETLAKGTPAWTWSAETPEGPIIVSMVFQEPTALAFIVAQTPGGTPLFNRRRPYDMRQYTPETLRSTLEDIRQEAHRSLRHSFRGALAA